MGGQCAEQQLLLFDNRIEYRARPEEAYRDFFWTRESGGSSQQTCYLNDSRVADMCWEENMNSWVLLGVSGRAREPRGVGGMCDFHGIKLEEMCWFALMLTEPLLAGIKSATFAKPSPQAVGQYLAATKRRHMPGWRAARSRRWWHRRLSQRFSSVISQSARGQRTSKWVAAQRISRRVSDVSHWGRLQTWLKLKIRFLKLLSKVRTLVHLSAAHSCRSSKKHSRWQKSCATSIGKTLHNDGVTFSCTFQSVGWRIFQSDWERHAREFFSFCLSKMSVWSL